MNTVYPLKMMYMSHTRKVIRYTASKRSEISDFGSMKYAETNSNVSKHIKKI